MNDKVKAGITGLLAAGLIILFMQTQLSGVSVKDVVSVEATDGKIILTDINQDTYTYTGNTAPAFSIYHATDNYGEEASFTLKRKLDSGWVSDEIYLQTPSKSLNCERQTYNPNVMGVKVGARGDTTFKTQYILKFDGVYGKDAWDKLKHQAELGRNDCGDDPAFWESKGFNSKADMEEYNFNNCRYTQQALDWGINPETGIFEGLSEQIDRIPSCRSPCNEYSIQCSGSAYDLYLAREPCSTCPYNGLAAEGEALTIKSTDDTVEFKTGPDQFTVRQLTLTGLDSETVQPDKPTLETIKQFFQGIYEDILSFFNRLLAGETNLGVYDVGDSITLTTSVEGVTQYDPDYQDGTVTYYYVRYTVYQDENVLIDSQPTEVDSNTYSKTITLNDLSKGEYKLVTVLASFSNTEDPDTGEWGDYDKVKEDEDVKSFTVVSSQPDPPSPSVLTDFFNGIINAFKELWGWITGG